MCFDACRHLEQEGFEVTYLPVHSDGLLDLNALKSAIKSNTLLVSIMAVNNELGDSTDCRIGKLIGITVCFIQMRHKQWAIPMDVEAMNIDMLSISKHKIYAQKVWCVMFVSVLGFDWLPD